jgi:hypothetical protein
VTRLPGTEQIVFANALAFDHAGTLYVTESYSMSSPTTFGPGGIWRIRRGVSRGQFRHASQSGVRHWQGRAHEPLRHESRLDVAPRAGPTGRRMSIVIIGRHRFEREKVVETWTSWDNVAALRQLGLLTA